MLATAWGLMIKMGAALLLLAVLIRPAITSAESRTADSLAILASVVVLLLGLVGRRVARRSEPADVERPEAPVNPRADWVRPRRRSEDAAVPPPVPPGVDEPGRS